MSTPPPIPVTAEERDLMIRAARAYYLEDLSKLQIAELLGISRFKVARLLEKAREVGIVTITILDGGTHVPEVARLLKDHLGLDQVIVVEAGGTEEDVRAEVGAAAATLLGQELHEGEILGLAWGRTLTQMSRALPPLPRLSVVQLTGAIGANLDVSPVEVVRRTSMQSGGTALPIFAPLVIEDAQTAASFRRQTVVANALQMFDSITSAVVSVGSWDPPNSQLLKVLPEKEQQELLAKGVRAEVAAILLSEEGELVAPEFAERCISIGAAQLRRVPRIIAVAAGVSKARAVRAVAKAGLCTQLVTDRALAEAILQLPARDTAPQS